MLTKRTPEPATSGTRRIVLVGGGEALVDEDLYDELSRYCWRAIRSGYGTYAIRRIAVKGRIVSVRMHRQIAKTPWGLVCHHKNRNTLDNRLANLNNMPDHLHRLIHFKV